MDSPEVSCSEMLKKSLKALEHPLCDRCLGRLFARSGFGIKNEVRGSALRTMLGMVMDGSADIRDIPPYVMGRLPVHAVEPSLKDGSLQEAHPDDDEGWNDPGSDPLPVPWSEERSGRDDVCWLCEGLFDCIEPMKELVIASAGEREFSNFQVGTVLEASMVYREQRLWEEVEPSKAEPMKEEFNRELGKALFEVWTDKGFERSDPEITFIVDPIYRTVKHQVKPLFIYGRYNKLIRGIPQTRWLCTKCKGRGCESCQGKGKRYETSVEESIGAHALEVTGGTDHSLHGMGREDIDVRTLGNGRPFVLEVSSPVKRSIDLKALEERIDRAEEGKVRVSGLRWSDRAEVRRIKESRATKVYEASISIEGDWTEESLKYGISLLGRSPIKQRTPDRVSHRRADLTRERLVHEMVATVRPDGLIVVTVRADAGLYIKELLHGDEGRTEPSLAGILGREVKVLALDVLSIDDTDDRTGG